MTEWIQNLDESELKYEAPSLFVFDEDPEGAAIFMYKEGYPAPINAVGDDEKFRKTSKAELEARPPKRYWEQVKSEMFILICTNDKKYDSLRKSLQETTDKSTKYILASIAGAVGGVLGVEAGILSGFCAIILHSIIKIGKETYCAIHN